MKKIFFALNLILFLSCNKNKDVHEVNLSGAVHTDETTSKIIPRDEIKQIDYSTYYKEAREYCKKKNLNQDTFILIDLGVHSGLKRFFVYDFKKDKVLKSYLVSHGCGDNRWGATLTKDNASISNEFDSHSSSIGKFVILDRGVSQWGIKVNYILQGKDKTNSNARSRAIVLHSWEAIPNDEVYPVGTPEGWGCPAVSNESMKEIDELLKTHNKVLMWIIKS
ncbi:murein L,D-transpeptidase catalytic domain-containing protein [Flavobacterium sp. FlaQc-48]|uniref:murein L,D-transpeptidase catalytic domain-containing protein n=1 Tax=Flavobacterium sp. FlaQc-48 TaxID=3374181 RepID=UPI003757737D